MSEVRSVPSPDPNDHLATVDERAMLEGFLDNYRDEVVRKVQGVSEEDARRRLVPSQTTLGGILKHLRWVEMGWFQRTLGRQPPESLPPVPWTEEDPDADFRMEPGESVDSLIVEYQAECDASRERAPQHQLDDVVPHRRMGQVSLRWIYLHLIEETARHAGHADILREQIDGSSGDWQL